MSRPDPAALKAAVIALARAEGFESVGIADPATIPEAGARLRRWVDDGAHGDMAWMADTLERRADPAVLWPDIRTVIMLGLNYGPDAPPRPAPADAATISVYAQAEDYHDVIKPKLKRIARALLAAAGDGDVKVFVDTAPVMEKPLAAAAGLGWQGRHTNLVSRGLGSWFFLGAIATTLELPPDTAEADHCGSCRACLDACPTDAFPAPYRIDARRCISYLTIEHKGPIPAALRPAMGNRIYGCDACLAACPWNKFAQEGREMRLAARAENGAPDLATLSRLDDPAFRARFPKSPVKRIGRDRFVRNVLIALGNGPATAHALDAVAARLGDPAPVVRGAAVWALRRLARTSVAAAAPLYLTDEDDPHVREEWAAALSASGASPPDAGG